MSLNYRGPAKIFANGEHQSGESKPCASAFGKVGTLAG